MTRIFKNKWFVRFARRESIPDSELCEAVRKAENGLIAADLGGGVIKQRVPRPGKGASSGYRTIILFRVGEKAFFVYGFPKSERDNIQKDELAAFKEMAAIVLSLSDTQLAAALKIGEYHEVVCDEET